MARFRTRTISRRTVEALKTDRDTMFWDRELPGFGVRVHPSGRKVYVAQTRARGKAAKRVTVGVHGVLTAEEARRRAALIIARIKAGEEPVPEPMAVKLAEGPKIAEIAERSVHAVAAMRLLLLTGCRKGEILNLLWDQVDMAAGELRLPDTKTGPRTITLSPGAVKVLSRIPRVPDNPFVIPGRIKGKAMRNLNDPWDVICDRAGLKDMRIHDCRHSYASRALALGESLPMIGRLLGHTQVETTARYAHLAQDSVRDSGVRVADSIAGDFLADYPGPENTGQ